MRGGLSDIFDLEAALTKLTKGLGKDHPIVSEAQIDVSEALFAMGKVDESETLLLHARKALKGSCSEVEIFKRQLLITLAI